MKKTNNIFIEQINISWWTKKKIDEISKEKKKSSNENQPLRWVNEIKWDRWNKMATLSAQIKELKTADISNELFK